MGSSGPGANCPRACPEVYRFTSKVVYQPPGPFQVFSLTSNSGPHTVWHSDRAYTQTAFMSAVTQAPGHLAIHSRVYSETWDNTVRFIIAWILRSSPLFRAQIGEFKAGFKNG